jgi:uncharacterized protein (TIGR00661 family)
MSEAKTPSKPRILVVPLDWGLGHATRCMPIIHAFLSQGCTVLLAGEGKPKNLLQKEFPRLVFLSLEGYRVRYAPKKWMLPFMMAAQIPKILFSIKKENRWLQTMVEKYSIDAVVSDNRFGLYHPAVPSVFITHQLSIKTGFGRLADQWLQKLNYRFIHRFSECWVPDAEGKNNLTGSLAHPETLPSVPVKFTGPLSRFAPSVEERANHILLLLSGPEPQRTILEKLLLEQLKEHSAPVVLVRGLPGSHEKIKAPSHVVVYNHLAAEDLQQKISEASFIISRCGYSTVMDLAALQKKSILIPTPGQTEQENLAAHLMKMNFALCIEQKKFDLANALELASVFNYQFQNLSSENSLKEIIADFRAQLQAKNKSC